MAKKPEKKVKVANDKLMTRARFNEIDYKPKKRGGYHMEESKEYNISFDLAKGTFEVKESK